MTKRNIIVFGATGSVGKELVSQAISAGNQVSAFTRSAAKVAFEHPDLSVIEGDVLDANQVRDAIVGHDAVLCTLGAGRHGYVRETATRNIVAGMQANKVERFICQSTLGAGDSVGNLNFFWKYIMFGTILRPVLIDHNKQENAVTNSDLHWTIVRPAAFTDGALTGNYQHGFSSNEKNLTFKISRSDVADFMLKQIACDSVGGKTIGLSY